MNLIKHAELKKKMLEVNPSFMKEKFDSGIDRANEARREMDIYLENMSHGVSETDANNLESAANNMALGLNHAAFTYDPNNKTQIMELNDIMANANQLIQLHGEYLNTIIHNYPRIGNSFDHIYDIMNDYSAIENSHQPHDIDNVQKTSQIQDLHLEKQNLEPVYNDPYMQPGPRPGF